ncbi:PREDICTED: [Prunus dulcis]|uniref:PREDICTED n=1 Tax=Prunus dulcis TaxID=3755 RepID=A0A5E4GA20_PRUDU|nr:PREDICTED: [Prunus dulcis]
MEFPSIPEASTYLNLSLAPPSNQETTHENVVFPHSNFHIGSTSVQAANMHNEIPATMNMLTPYANLVMAKRSNKTAVKETNFFSGHCAGSVTNVGLHLLARNQERATLIAQVTSLKDEVAKLHRLLKHAN